jgi:hypothetical protein
MPSSEITIKVRKTTIYWFVAIVVVIGLIFFLFIVNLTNLHRLWEMLINTTTDTMTIGSAKQIEKLESSYWTAAGGFSSYITALLTGFIALISFIGFVISFILIYIGIGQLKATASSTQSAARQQYMRMLFDLNLAALDHPELLARVMGDTKMEYMSPEYYKFRTYSDAFLNLCEMIYNYYYNFERKNIDHYWKAWSATISFYLGKSSELRSFAWENIKYDMYTEEYEQELKKLLEEVEHNERDATDHDFNAGSAAV